MWVWDDIKRERQNTTAQQHWYQLLCLFFTEKGEHFSLGLVWRENRERTNKGKESPFFWIGFGFGFCSADLECEVNRVCLTPFV
jgi:hypothetical protein